MKAYPISVNIHILEDLNFGKYNKEVVHRLLQQVQIDFSSWIGNEVFSTSNCLLSYQDKYPEIGYMGEIGHQIRLNVKEDDWWRWVYQFAHEYCHHLINGAMSNEVTGLIWFEETICDLASICHLNRLIALCDVLQIDNHYKDIVMEYYELSLGTVQSNCLEYLKQHMGELVEPEYHREIYSNLSATMLSLFLENTHLWKIILHFGDMRSWNSLEDLFAHLRETADDSYSVSLDKLYNMLCCNNDYV